VTLGTEIAAPDEVFGLRAMAEHAAEHAVDYDDEVLFWLADQLGQAADALKSSLTRRLPAPLLKPAA
jgi:hypothetical protein